MIEQKIQLIILTLIIVVNFKRQMKIKLINATGTFKRFRLRERVRERERD